MKYIKTELQFLNENNNDALSYVFDEELYKNIMHHLDFFNKYDFVIYKDEISKNRDYNFIENNNKGVFFRNLLLPKNNWITTYFGIYMYYSIDKKIHVQLFDKFLFNKQHEIILHNINDIQNIFDKILLWMFKTYKAYEQQNYNIFNTDVYQNMAKYFNQSDITFNLLIEYDFLLSIREFISMQKLYKAFDEQYDSYYRILQLINYKLSENNNIKLPTSFLKNVIKALYEFYGNNSVLYAYSMIMCISYGTNHISTIIKNLTLKYLIKKCNNPKYYERVIKDFSNKEIINSFKNTTFLIEVKNLINTTFHNDKNTLDLI